MNFSGTGLILSPEFSLSDVRLVFWEFVKKHNIPVFNRQISCSIPKTNRSISTSVTDLAKYSRDSDFNTLPRAFHL